MGAEQALYLWLAVSNITPLLMLVIAERGLPSSPSKRAFLVFLLSYIVFCNPLIVVQLLTPSHYLMPFCSTMIHLAGVFFIGLLGYFLIVFSNPTEISKARFWFFQINYLVLSVVILFGLVEEGAEYSASGLRPKPGILNPYFHISMLAYCLYFCWVCRRAYVLAHSELLKQQLKTLLITGIPAFAMFMITNTIIPLLTQDYQVTPVGVMWFFIFFAGIIHVLYFSRSLVLNSIVSDLMALPLMRLPGNIDVLADYLRSIGEAVTNNSLPQRTFRIEGGAGPLPELTSTNGVDIKSHQAGANSRQ